MTYSRTDKTVTVEFNVTEFAELMAILGAARMLVPPNSSVEADIGKFIEELNRTNPDYGLYANHEFEAQ